MSVRSRALWTGAAVSLVALFTAAGLAGHRWALTHVRYYTGAEPKVLNCATCHLYARGGSPLDRVLRPRYYTPMDLAVSPDGQWLYITAQERNALLVVEVAPGEGGRVVAEIEVGQRPHGVILSRDGRTAYVTNEGSDNVSIVDLESRRVVKSLPTGDAPAGLALSPDGITLFVANWFGNDISVFDLQRGVEVKRLAGGSNPYDMALSPDGGSLLVTNQLSYITSRPNPPVSEVTVLDVRQQRVTARRQVHNAHLLEGVAFTPQGDLALVTLVRPKNLLPAIQVARGWMMTNGLGVVDMRDGHVAQVLLDEVNAFYADPCDVVLTPDGRYAFVTHSGADCVTVVEVEKLRALLGDAPPETLSTYANHLGLSRRYVVKRIPTGANPKGLAVSPDGRFVYVAERLADRIAVIEVEKLEQVAAIDLGGPKHETVLRRGEKLFNSSRATFQGQFSCRSCHPNNHLDRLQFDLEPDGLGRNIVDNRTLLDIRETGPFKWNGKNTSLYMQCGIRFAKFLTRVEPFSPEELNALVAFMGSLRHPPNRNQSADGELTPAQQRGKAIFERSVDKAGNPIPERNRCITCHPPPYFTNRKRENVSSASPTDSAQEFDTPQLNNVYESTPYLHDGKALTLEEIWIKYSPDDTHGVTNDLGKEGLNNLIEYLKTL